jgi:outer membrane protein assembly factor BamB
MSDHRRCETGGTRWRFPCGVLALWAALFWTAPALAETPPELAERILSQDGVRAGLCVQIGCGDGELTLALRRGGRYVVHGISTDAGRVEQARATIRAAGAYGPVSVERATMKSLPYRPGIANVIVVDDFAARQREGLTLAEVVRVLAPYGSAFLRGGPEKAEGMSIEPLDGGWVRLRKPYPEEMDEWTHFEHDAARTSVSTDKRVALPISMRWTGGLRWPDWTYGARGGTGFASAAGRNFYLCAELSSTKSRLECRDAFNGLLLWRKPIARTGHPAALIAVGDRVYGHNGGPAGLVALDAVTGEQVVHYKESQDHKNAEMLVSDGVLLQSAAGVRAFDAAGGQLLWEKPNARAEIDSILVGAGLVIYLQRQAKEEPLNLVGCDLKTGREQWRSDVTTLEQTNPLSLILYRKDMIILASSSRLLNREHHGVTESSTYAVSARDGRLLWKYSYPTTPHFGTATSVFYLGDLVWVKREGASDRDRYAWVGLDPKDGTVKKRSKSGYNRCYPDRALTDRLLTGDVDFLDPVTGRAAGTKAARGDCVTGFIPANGLTYIFPQRCHCANYLRGMMAFSADPAPTDEPTPDEFSARLEKGPAFGDVPAAVVSTDDWPTFRHDALRSGGTRAAVPTKLKTIWDAPVGAGVTSPVVAGGRVFVAAEDEHRVVCLDAATGAPVWSFVAGGRIDSPPTIHKGLALFGSADGWVYCLRAADGELVWRFRAAPTDERIASDGRLDSVWPMHGSVLVQDDVAFFVAGRHSHLDGGLHYYAADPSTGRILWHRRAAKSAGDNLGDVLVSDGEAIHIGHRIVFDPKTGKRRKPGGNGLFAASGLVEDNAIFPGAHYQYRQLVYGTINGRGEPRGYVNYPVRSDCWYGKLLAFDKDGVFGSAYVGYWNPGRYEWELFGYTSLTEDTGVSTGSYASAKRKKPHWTAPVAIEFKQGPKVGAKRPQTQAVLLTESTLFAAQQSADGKTGELWTLSRKDGSELAERLPLPTTPRWDGLAAVPGKLFISTQTGRLLCLGEE